MNRLCPLSLRAPSLVAMPAPSPSLDWSVRGVNEIPYLCRALYSGSRKRADINLRRILLVFCFQHKSIPRGWAGALTWVVSLHPAGE